MSHAPQKHTRGPSIFLLEFSFVDGITKADAVEVECPFCHRAVFAVEKPQVIIHSRPPCVEFDKRTLNEILLALSGGAARGQD